MTGIDITPSQDGGVLKEVLVPGEGDDSPPGGSTVKAHYHGTLEDGTVFDSSVDRGEPFSFTLGQGNITHKSRNTLPLSEEVFSGILYSIQAGVS